MKRSLQVKPSKVEKNKGDFTAIGILSMHTLIYGLSLKSLEWLDIEITREIKCRKKSL